jgi:hypothetical protein
MPATMTNVELLLWALVLCLLIGAIVTVTQLITYGRQLWLDTQRGVNGAALVVVRGTVRRLIVRLAIQSALVAQFGTRLVGVRNQEMTTVIVLVIVLSLAVDTVGDAFDLRVLRYMLLGTCRRDDHQQRS